MHFSPGDIAVLRGILKGKLWFACPTYVVQDSDDLVALYWRVGTPILAPVGRPTVEDELYNRVELEYRHWVYNDILSLAIPGKGFSIELMWPGGTHDLLCWYIHLQEPMRRSAIGFDTMDQMLDIVISPDRKSWQWKDEDELSRAEAIGVYSAEQVRLIRSEAQEVIARLNANASPFGDGWEQWYPPGDWAIPQFPPAWEHAPLSW